MMGALRTWFTALSARERMLVLVAGVLAAVTLLWFGITRPLIDGLADARARHAGAVSRLADAERALAAVRPLAGLGAPRIAGTLDTAIRDRANAAGFALTSVAPEGEGIAIGIASARPGALFAWIADLEREGLLVDRLQTTDNGDRTLSVAMTLKPRRP